MTILAGVVGVGLVILVLWEGFETMVLPRRVTRRFRLTRVFYRSTWFSWVTTVRTLFPARSQENMLSYFGPLSLLLLLSVWAGGLITGFALLYWATAQGAAGTVGNAGFLTDFYLSGTTFFTLGLGDVTPHTSLARVLVVLEAGMGFAFLALVIGYLPALNQTFARREVRISLLDARAGSPPTALEMMRRHSHERGQEALRQLLHEWELWSAEFLEGHLSYPVLAYFRSQHDNQSWLGALTTILDTCTLVMVGVEGVCARQAELTFAMARHAVVDLTHVFRTPPKEPKRHRLTAAELGILRQELVRAGFRLRDGEASDQRLAELRRMYEPYVHALAAYFHIHVPPWFTTTESPDNWQTSGWERRSAGSKRSLRSDTAKEHF